MEEVIGGVASGVKSKWAAIVLSSVVVAAAEAMPTMSDCDRRRITCAMSPGSRAHATFMFGSSRTTEPCSLRLVGITAEFLKPPSYFACSPSAPIQAKLLPAVPAALLMVLTGFLCVSLVKDRKAWLAVLAAEKVVGVIV